MHSLSFRTSNVTNANPCLEIIAHATIPCRIRKIEATQVTAAATAIGLGRPAAKGVGPTSPLTALADDSGLAAGNTTGAVAWTTTAPTIPGQFLRRVALAAAIGEKFVWEWAANAPLIVVPSGSIVLWNILGGATLDVNVVIDESV